MASQFHQSPNRDTRDHAVYFHGRADDALSPVFYVGRGRPNRVRCLSKRDRNSYWANIKDKHGVVRMIAVDGLSFLASCAIERFWIGVLRSCGAAEANLSDGGELSAIGYRHGAESRQRMRDAAIARGPLPPEHRENIRRGLMMRLHGDPDFKPGPRGPRPSRYKAKPKRRFVHVQSGVIYTSQRKCAAELGLSKTGTAKIGDVLSGKMASTRGHQFVWIDGQD